MRPDRLARLHAAVDRQAGERVRIVPYAAGGYVAGAPDPTRASIEIVATVTEVPKITRTAGNATNSGHNAELRTASHTVTFTTSSVPYPLRSADQVVLLDRGAIVLTVNSADPYGTDRTVARLERLTTVLRA